MSDPFPYRENFPQFEEAFEEATNTSSDDDDWSIGARAALQEHARWVAKYGLDDSRQQQQEEEEEDDEQVPDNSLDQAWEHLLLTSEEEEVVNSTLLREDDDGQYWRQYSTPTEEGVEVVDTSRCSDEYFNSSRIQLLATPERVTNLPKTAAAPTIRMKEDVNESGDDTEEYFLLGLIQHAADQSFSVDVSRISSAPSPNSSFVTDTISFSPQRSSRPTTTASPRKWLPPRPSPPSSRTRPSNDDWPDNVLPVVSTDTQSSRSSTSTTRSSPNDRRRYRSVVPSRVFGEDWNQEERL